MKQTRTKAKSSFIMFVLSLIMSIIGTILVFYNKTIRRGHAPSLLFIKLQESSGISVTVIYKSIYFKELRFICSIDFGIWCWLNEVN